ncbi:MAG: hypothetical protein KAR17_10145 [Cyclobacteriaceae bacterium]|nr:hypothetical protein [Cyclobacteriaceae bacterium]
MKNTISLLLCFSLLTCLSLNLYSQSAENELDQVKLTKQIIGTWETRVGEDSIIQMTCTPFGEGIRCQFEWKSDGKVYSEASSVIGFSADRKTIVYTYVRGDGTTTHDIGRFVTEKKWVTERFLSDSPTHAHALAEHEFPSPTTFKFSMCGRGTNITWEPQWESTITYTKIK